MIHAYNHFLTEYSPKFNARPLAHQQKELKAVYNRIRSLNRNSAYYKLDISNDKQLFTLSLKDAAQDLSSMLKELFNTFQKPIMVREAFSSNPAAVSVSLANGEPNNPEQTHEISVQQLAQPQINAGRIVLSDAEGPLPASYRFMIHTEEGNYEFSYQVDSSFRNGNLLDKLSKFINELDIGILSSVEEDEAGRTSRLVLTSKESGIPDNDALLFTIEDSNRPVTEMPGLVSYYSLDQVAQRPANAKFTIDGAEKTSLLNTFLLDRALSVTLRSVTEAPVHIAPVIPKEQFREEAQNFLNIYNSVVKLSVGGLPGNRRSAKLQYELNRIVSSDPKALEEAGLVWNLDSTLSFKDGALSDPVTAKNMKALFEEPDGILARLSRKAQDIVLNPMEYVDKVIITYPNTSRAGFSNPYAISIYSGMFFNSYC